jgi:hypothetical protein
LPPQGQIILVNEQTFCHQRRIALKRVPPFRSLQQACRRDALYREIALMTPSETALSSCVVMF